MTGSDAAPYTYEVRLSQNAALAYGNISSAYDLKHVNKVLELLDTVPEIGHPYDPVYDSARPTVPVRVVFAGNYGIYYAVDEETKVVQVHFLEDQRQDPLSLFG